MLGIKPAGVYFEEVFFKGPASKRELTVDHYNLWMELFPC